MTQLHSASDASSGAAATHCRLCGLSLRVIRPVSGVFCCTGCERVFDVLSNLDPDAGAAYVEAARRMGIIPSGPEDLPSDARAARSVPMDFEAVKEERFDATGMSCPSCSWVMEQILLSQDGVLEAEVNFFGGSAHVRFDMRRQSHDKLAGTMKPFGYGLVRQSHSESSSGSGSLMFAFVVSAIVTVNLMMLSSLRYAKGFSLVSDIPGELAWFEFVLCVPVLWMGWIPMVRRALGGLRVRRVNMDVLLAVAVGAAGLLSCLSLLTGHDQIFFETCSGLVTISLLSRLIEARLRDRASEQITRMMRTRVVTVRHLTARGAVDYVPVRQIGPGDRVRFESGDVIPFDGRVASDEVWVSEAVLTGEPEPVRKVHGDGIVGGVSLVEGQLDLDVTRGFEQTKLFQITDSMRQALASQEMALRSGDRIAAWFTPLVLGLALAVWVARVVVGGEAALLHMETWFPSIAMLAVACPCAFSLAGVCAVTAATGALLRRGVIVRDSVQLEMLCRVETFVFDKTGTLTRGNLAVTQQIWFDEPDDALLAAVLAAERDSVHPVAGAIRAHLRDQGINESDESIGTIEDLPGRGRVLCVGDRKARVGVRGLFDGAPWPEQTSLRTTVVHFGWDDRAAGCFLLEDELKPDAMQLIQHLKRRGMETMLMSGDGREATAWVGQQVGADCVMAELSLEDKVQRVRDLVAQGRTVAFIGDGTNDALAMGEAHVAVAVAKSTDEALAASGMVLAHGKLLPVAQLVDTAHRLRRVIMENYAWAFVFNALFVPVAALGGLTPLAAMLLMFLSSTLVLLNSTRLRKLKAPHITIDAHPPER